MADYIYLLENRLSPPQRAALRGVQKLAAAHGMTVFLVGGAVRDLTSGSPVRDLDFAVQGSALELRAGLEADGAEVNGVQESLGSLYLLMPGGVRAEVGSTLSAAYPKPAQPVFTPAPLGDDLRRRDFTANAMALSLNEGSYGLLIDPLNGVADIENRQLRLVSNYGFLEEPVRLIRAARLMARMGWTLEEKTRARYDTAVGEGYISQLSPFYRGYELEEIVHEDEPLRILQRLEEDGWMKALYPAWTASRVNGPELERLREAQLELQVQGIAASAGAAAFPLLTAKMTEKDRAALKAMFPSRGFVREADALEAEAKEFAAQLTSKAATLPSAAWKLIHVTRPEAVLQALFSSRSPAVQAKFKAFVSEWPQARQRIPHTLLQEMRIGPELPGYEELLDSIFFALMDGELKTDEEMRVFLEPYSPPAPPLAAQVKRGRAAKKTAKGKKGRAEMGDPEPVAEAAPADVEAGELATVGAGNEPVSDLQAGTGDAEPEPAPEQAVEPEPPAPEPIAVAVQRSPGKQAQKNPAAKKKAAARTSPAKPAPSVKKSNATAGTKKKAGKASAVKAAPVKSKAGAKVVKSRTAAVGKPAPKAAKAASGTRSQPKAAKAALHKASKPSVKVASRTAKPAAAKRVKQAKPVKAKPKKRAGGKQASR